jgi:pimeloyl-ACP methyl ester carboxylesterase
VFIDYWNRPGSWSKMPERLREQSRALGWKMFLEVRSCFFEDTPFGSWSIPAPGTIACGDRSPATSRAMARELARGRADVALVEIPGVSHMAPLTQPTLVHEALARHLQRVTR